MTATGELLPARPESDAARRRRVAFGALLRHRRTALRPEDLGIAVTGRRHVRGLRRDEVAAAARIGVSWYTMLEQGRVDSVAPRTLNAIADALRLAPAERAYLQDLAAGSFEIAPARATPPPAALLRFVRGYPVGHAHLHDARFDLHAWNGVADELYDIARHGERPNLLDIMVTNPAIRARFVEPDWLYTLQQMVNHLRNLFATSGDASFGALVDALAAKSPEFARLWAELPFDFPPVIRQRFAHPRLGTVTWRVTPFTVPSLPNWTLILKTEESPR